MIGGVESSIEEFPYLVSVEMYKNNFSMFICGGSIISSFHILTAAHCVDNFLFSIKIKLQPSYRVRAGSSLRGEGGTLHRVAESIIHEESYWKSGVYVNDIAVLRLENPIYFDYITKRPIKMFQSGQECKARAIAMAAGWGRLTYAGDFPKQMHCLVLKVVDKKNCSESFKAIGGLEAGEICAKFVNDKKYKSACHGDSGGPLVINGKLAGIMAHVGIGCTTLKHPNVFTEIAHYRDWIDQNLLIWIIFHRT